MEASNRQHVITDRHSNFFEGSAKKAFQEVTDDVSIGKKTEVVNIESTFPKNMSYNQYLGSITTPSLTENVGGPI